MTSPPLSYLFCDFKVLITPSSRIRRSRTSSSGRLRGLRVERLEDAITHSILAFAQLPQGFFLSHLTFLFLHATQELKCCEPDPLLLPFRPIGYPGVVLAGMAMVCAGVWLGTGTSECCSVIARTAEEECCLNRQVECVSRRWGRRKVQVGRLAIKGCSFLGGSRRDPWQNVADVWCSEACFRRHHRHRRGTRTGRSGRGYHHPLRKRTRTTSAMESEQQKGDMEWQEEESSEGTLSHTRTKKKTTPKAAGSMVEAI